MDRGGIAVESADGPAAASPVRWTALLGYGIALGGMAWVLHDVRLGEVLPYLRNLDWRWITAAAAFDLLTYAAQGVRWELLLRQTGKLSPLKATQAIYAGLFTNELLPLRVGELVRGYLAAKWLDVPILRVVPSMAVERLFDGIWLVLAVGFTALFVPLPKNVEHAAEILALAMLCGVGVLVFLAKRTLQATGQSPDDVKGLRRFYRELLAGLDGIGQSWNTCAAFFASALLPATQAAAFWFALGAYHIHRPFTVALAVCLIVRLGTMIPNAPANIGSFQFFCVLGLMLFGVDKARATGFSMVVFLVLTIPLWLLGTLAIGASGSSLADIRRKIASRAAAI